MIIERIKKIINDGARPSTWVNDRGNTVTTGFVGSCDRYVFDTQLCTKEAGFEQFDTDQDAHYFGVWVSRDNRATVTYAEGDLTLVACASEEGFKAEIADAEKFYGKAPPAFIGIDVGSGEVTEFYSERASAETL